jgi:hypothetical protein
MSSRRSEQQREVAEFFQAGFIIALMLTALWIFQGCTGGIPQHAQCDETKVAAFTARCAVQVRMLCDQDPSVECPVEEACEKQLCELCPMATECAK